MRLGLSKQWNDLENGLSKLLVEIHELVDHVFWELNYGLLGTFMAKVIK